MSKHILMTPFGKAVFPHIITPDNYEGALKFKTNLELSEEDQALFEAKIDAIAKGERFKVKKPAMPYKDDEKYGRSLAMSSKFKPAVFDAKNKKLPEGTNIGGGSIIRCQVEVFNYDKGLSLRLLQVQVKELKDFGDRETSAFGEVEDGYEAPEEDASSFEESSEEGAGSALDI